MAIFSYEALREPGESVRGEIEAEDAFAASAMLLRRGCHVLRIEDTAASTGKRPKLGGWGGLKHRDLVRFTRDMASLLKAGLPLSTALNTLRERDAHPVWKGIIGGLRARLEDGQTFSQSLAAFPDLFTPVYTNLVHAGEEGGNLVEVLNRLAALGEQREELRSRARMAMVYPAVLLSLGVIVVFVMMAFVVPEFTSVFDETGQALPLPTILLIAISSFLGRFWWLVIPVAVGLGAMALKWAQSPAGERMLGNLILRMPLAGPLLQRIQLGFFARTLGTLLECGVPIVAALRITADTLGNNRYREAVAGLAAIVRDGEVLSRAIEGNPLFTSSLPSILAVGEHGGTLPETLGHAADEFDRDADRQVKVVMTLIEPLMIVLLGGVIGFIVLAMLLPIFNLGDSVQL
jgi:type II secretory pathway component PulF